LSRNLEQRDTVLRNPWQDKFIPQLILKIKLENIFSIE
jgi:hypothetical protein